MKATGAVNNVAKVIGKVANKLAKKVIDRLSEDGLKGMEENITSQLAGELTGHLLESIKKELNGITLRGVSFKVYYYRKKTEKHVGADLAGILRITQGGKECKKAFLGQAKVARTAYRNGKKIKFTAGDKNLLPQCKKMIKKTPASFVLIYSNFGVSVVPALSVCCLEEGKINSEKSFYKSLAEFFSDFFKCFIGDPTLAVSYKKPADLSRVAMKHNVSHALAIEAEVPSATATT